MKRGGAYENHGQPGVNTVALRFKAVTKTNNGPIFIFTGADRSGHLNSGILFGILFIRTDLYNATFSVSKFYE